jgi:hypothetical protein
MPWRKIPGWEPIDTAPKDAEVLVFGIEGYPGPPDRIWIASWSIDKWVEPGDGRTIYPTHWMPLPNPPSDSRRWPWL